MRLPRKRRPLSGEAWFTLAIVVLTIALLATERLPPAVVLGGAVTVLAVAGIIEQRQSPDGFLQRSPDHGGGPLRAGGRRGGDGGVQLGSLPVAPDWRTRTSLIRATSSVSRDSTATHTPASRRASALTPASKRPWRRRPRATARGLPHPHSCCSPLGLTYAVGVGDLLGVSTSSEPAEFW